jgi:hypothetical protein
VEGAVEPGVPEAPAEGRTLDAPEVESYTTPKPFDLLAFDADSTSS